jgi:CheY-like chemotaxis protein
VTALLRGDLPYAAGAVTTVDGEFAIPRLISRVDEVPDTPRLVALENNDVGSETILLVEDEEMLCAATREMLEGAGYTVLAAGSAAEALEVAARHRGPIHVVVTDVIMPEINGPELVRRLAPSRPAAKILYVSGYTEDAMAHVELGSHEAFLNKPLTSAVLCRKVRALLRSPHRNLSSFANRPCLS